MRACLSRCVPQNSRSIAVRLVTRGGQRAVSGIRSVGGGGDDKVTTRWIGRRGFRLPFRWDWSRVVVIGEDVVGDLEGEVRGSVSCAAPRLNLASAIGRRMLPNPGVTRGRTRFASLFLLGLV